MSFKKYILFKWCLYGNKRETEKKVWQREKERENTMKGRREKAKGEGRIPGPSVSVSGRGS